MSAFPASADAWGIADATLIADGIGGRVWRVQLADGRRAIVKAPSDLALQDGEPLRAVAFMRWRNGMGCAHLLDAKGDLQLQEFAGDQTLLDLLRSEGDDRATEIACDVLQTLHAPSPQQPPSALQSLPDYFHSLFVRAAVDRQTGGDSQFIEAASLAERLLAADTEKIPLHGDIHHENIILGHRGWLTIDPKGLIGDAAFDAANLFYNPVEHDIRYEPARIARMAAILSARLSFDSARLLDWAFAFSALSASWHDEDGNSEEAQRSLRVGRAVGEVRLSQMQDR